MIMRKRLADRNEGKRMLTGAYGKGGGRAKERDVNKWQQRESAGRWVSLEQGLARRQVPGFSSLMVFIAGSSGVPLPPRPVPSRPTPFRPSPAPT